MFREVRRTCRFHPATKSSHNSGLVTSYDQTFLTNISYTLNISSGKYPLLGRELIDRSLIVPVVHLYYEADADDNDDEYD